MFRNSVIQIGAIAAGEVDDVTEEMESLYRETGNHRVKRLIGYLNRFSEALNYDEFKDKGSCRFRRSGECPQIHSPTETENSRSVLASDFNQSDAFFENIESEWLVERFLE